MTITTISSALRRRRERQAATARSRAPARRRCNDESAMPAVSPRCRRADGASWKPRIFTVSASLSDALTEVYPRICDPDVPIPHFARRGGRRHAFRRGDALVQSILGPGTDHLAAVTGIHQVEAFLEIVDVDLVRQHLLQREAGQQHLRHLVPGLVHAPAVDAVQHEALEDDLV